MWKRDEAVRPVSGGQPVPAAQPPAPAPAGITGSRPETQQLMEKDIVNIGKSVVIKGELNGSEDLTIEGHVEGTIQLRDHILTIGPNGRIKAQVFAKSVVVLGEVTGNVTASDKVEIRDAGDPFIGIDASWACWTASHLVANRTRRLCSPCRTPSLCFPPRRSASS